MATFAYESCQPACMWRIDAVVVDVDDEARVQRVEHFKSIYEERV